MVTDRLRGSPVVAAIVAVLSVGWAVVPDRADGVWLWILALMVGAAGIIVAAGLWRGRRWSLRAYVAWATVALIGFVVRDAQVEPVLWNVAVGAGVVTAVLLVMGLAAKSTQAKPRWGNPPDV